MLTADRARLSPTFTVKNGVRYRYYVSEKRGNWRLPAREIENLVLNAACTFLRDTKQLLTALGPYLSTSAITAARQEARQLAARFSGEATADRAAALSTLLERVVLTPQSVTLECKQAGLQKLLGMNGDLAPPDKIYRITVPTALQRRGVESRLVVPDESGHRRPDQKLLKLVSQAYCWVQELLSGATKSVEEIAKREGIDATEVTRVLPCGFLAPTIVKAILEGRRSLSFTAEKVKRRWNLPTEWAEQELLSRNSLS